VSFSIVAVLVVPWRAKHQEIGFGIWFEDADGGRLPTFEGRFQVGSPADSKVGDASIVPLSLAVGNLALPSAGDYAAVLEVQGIEVSGGVSGPCRS
jgi:Family of unknown function (DUF6941)